MQVDLLLGFFILGWRFVFLVLLVFGQIEVSELCFSRDWARCRAALGEKKIILISIQVAGLMTCDHIMTHLFTPVDF